MVEPAAELSFPRQKQTERVIAFARLVLVAMWAGFSWTGPADPGAARFGFLVIAGGSTYALGTVILAWRPGTRGLRATTWLHAADIVLFSLLAAHGSASLVLPSYVFLLLSATLQWHARGVIWTGVAAGLAVAAIGAGTVAVAASPRFDLLRLTPAVACIWAATLLLVIGRQQQRFQRHLTTLMSWPSTTSTDDNASLREMLRHVARVLNARRVVLIQDDPEEPWISIAEYGTEGYLLLREPAPSSEAFIADALTGASFFCDDASARASRVIYRSPEGLQRWRGQPLSAAMQARLGRDRIISCPLTSTAGRGRIFFARDERGSFGDLRLAELATGMFAARLDQQQLSRRLRDEAVREERDRFSRDLHDGLLQSLTAWGLQIGDFARRLESTDPIVAHRLQEIRRQMTRDQRELRSAIGRPKPGDAIEPVEFSLIGRLHDLRDRFAQEWGLAVQMDVSGPQAFVPPVLRPEVCRIVHEGLSNAARHAQTPLVRIHVAATDDDIFLSIQDRGRGFPFRGRHDLAGLRAQGIGPSSLIDRVSALGGELVLESSDAGARLDIVLPFDRPVERRQLPPVLAGTCRAADFRVAAEQWG